MRAYLSGNPRHRRLAAAALVGPALALMPLTAPAFADTTSGQTAPSTAPKPDVNAPVPASRPAQPAHHEDVDAAVAITGTRRAKPGSIVGITASARASVPTKGYVLTITPSRGVKIYEWDVQNGWACVDTAAFGLSCKYTRAATTTPSTMHVAFQLPKKRGHFDFTAKVKTANPDPDKTNNTATWRVKTTAPTPTPKPTPTPTPTTTPAPPTSRVTVTGRIWNDANHNGRQDAGEKGIRGAKVVLLRTDGDSDREMRRVTTGSDGRYWFTRLPVLDPGTSRYVVLVGTPNRSWEFTKRDVGAERGDSDLTLDVPSGGPMPSYHRYFTKNSVVGYSDGMIIKAGKTGVVDGGLVKDGGSGGETLPQTGVAAQGIAAGGGLLVAGGVALTLLGRRRRTANAAR